MKWKKVWSLLCTVGLPWGIITTATGIFIKYWYIINNPRQHKVRLESIEDIKTILLCSVGVMGWIFIKNLAHIGSGKDIGMCTWLNKPKYEPPTVSPRKIKAMHPPIDKEYLSSEPDGLVLGYDKREKKYIRYPISKNHALSAILVGLPGSGKSTLLISSLAYQNHFASKEDRQVYFILDCKPELKKKTTYPYDKHMRELSIDDRSQWGWDAYHALNKCKNDDERLSALDVIARALIDAGKNSKNEFFYQSGRAIIKALFLSYYKAGRSLGQSLHILRESNIQDLIKTTLENTNGNPDLIKVKRGLKQYEGKEGEAFQGIGLAINEAIEILDKDDVEFFLDVNPRKLSCDTLEKKISIAFTLQVAKIREYKTILRLVVMQLISHCEQRSEDSHLITMIIDEAYRLGVINWIDFLSVCRSKQVSCVLAFQSLTQMQSVWSKEDADSLVEMVGAIAVLSARGETTTKLITGWAGTYEREKISTNYGGNNDGSYSLSYEDKNILDASDLMKLKKRNEIVLFLDGEFYMGSVSGAQYFNIKKLNEISKKCLAAHERIEKEKADKNK